MQLKQTIAGLLVGTCLAMGTVLGPLQAQEILRLPAPETRGGMPLLEALAQRHSTREFRDEALSPQTLANLLWAAFGINRAEGDERTAPSWRHSKETDIYVATADGVSVYDAKANSLRRILQGDIRKRTSSLVFVANAPVVLIYVADRARMAKAPAEEQILNAHVDRYALHPASRPRSQ